MLRCLPILAALLAAAPAGAQTLGVGDSLPALALEDQHGDPYALDASARLVFFSRDMDGGGVVQAALAEDGAQLLERHAAVYVVDVSGMPAMIRRVFAKPAMRRRPYRMLLDEDGGPTAGFPSRPGHATLLFVETLKIVRVEYVDAPEALRAALEPEPED